MLIALCETGTQNEWMLQVMPLVLPGLLGRWLGIDPSATSTECLELARHVDHALKETNTFSGFKWCWDGFPATGSSEPLEWD